MDQPIQEESPPSQAGPSRLSRGLSLPHRPASVVVHGKNEEPQLAQSEEGAVGLARRDSLEKTRDFYGFRPSSSASNMKDSTSSRYKDDQLLMRQRSDSRVSHTTRGSTYTRPTSPDATSVTSPRRSTTIPAPRAFLTPKKPKAAMRMEQLERERARQSHQPPLPSFGTASASTDPSPSRSTGEPSPPHPSHGPTASQSGNSISTQGSNANTGLAMHKPDPLLSRIEESYSQSPLDSSLQHSLTNLSTPPHIHHELSSDDLVHLDTSPSHNGFPPKAASPPRSRQYSRPSPTREPSDSKGRVRRYKKFENTQTTFFAGGHLMTGGDYPWSAILTVVIILGLTGVWVGTTGVWLWVHGTEYGLAKGGGIAIVIVLVYLFGLVMSSLVVTAFRDPGIIPRNLDPDPPVTLFDGYYDPDNRDLTVKKKSVTVKYCETCNSYRPPRASHCRLCGNCVDGIDHHCGYLHNCIGKRNYLPFITLLVTAAISDIYIVVFSALHFSLLCHHDHVSFGTALRDSPGAAVSFLLGVICLGPVAFLLWYHLRLVLYNLTTVEQIRASASSNLLSSFVQKRPENHPFGSDSLLSNILHASLGRPQFPSWVNASGWYEEDKRQVNPALTDPRWSPQGGMGKSTFG